MQDVGSGRGPDGPSRLRGHRRRPAAAVPPPPRALPLLLLLTAAAAGCAAPMPSPPPEPPLPYPPAARERMLRIAIEEWREWGGLVHDPGGPPPPAGPEARPENFPRVLAYWRALDDDEGAVARNRALYRAALEGRPEGEALWRRPFWSAAFVSYVLRAAGVDRAEFPPAAAHATYVDAMVATALRAPAAAPFVPHGPAERAPRPGDLVCADRGAGAPPLTHWRQRGGDAGRFRPMHCDIVVAAGPGVVEAVGGNVLDAVTLTRFPTDASGRLLPPPPGAPTPFAVFENRLGCLPPWGPPCPGPPPGGGAPAARLLPRGGGHGPAGLAWRTAGGAQAPQRRPTDPHPESPTQ
jgi:hypothetical protein